MIFLRIFCSFIFSFLSCNFLGILIHTYLGILIIWGYLFSKIFKGVGLFITASSRGTELSESLMFVMNSVLLLEIFNPILFGMGSSCVISSILCAKNNKIKSKKFIILLLFFFYTFYKVSFPCHTLLKGFATVLFFF